MLMNTILRNDPPWYRSCMSHPDTQKEERNIGLEDHLSFFQVGKYLRSHTGLTHIRQLKKKQNRWQMYANVW